MGVANVDDVLHLNSVATGVVTLGPSPSVGVWTQYCPLACPGCMSPDTKTRSGGVYASVRSVAEWIESTNLGRLTVSGGEPTVQAAALSALFQLLDQSWLITVYSGYGLAELRERHDAAVDTLLGRVDLLIAGRYERKRHADLLWRGSANQRIHNLSGRLVLPADRSAGVRTRVEDGMVATIGVPSRPDFLRRQREAFAARGLSLGTDQVTARFPFPLLPS